MYHFVLYSEYKPMGYQPEVIEAFVDDFKDGNQFRTLLDVTGSSKIFTMTNIYEKNVTE